MRSLRQLILLAGALVLAALWSGGSPEPAMAGPRPSGDATMFPVDLCLRIVRPDGDRPCVHLVDGAGRGWYVAQVVGVHRSMRSLSFKPGKSVRVIGEACTDCVQPRCGTFAGFIFDARIVPYRRGDVNGDGETNTGDLVAVLDALGDCPDSPALCPADLNGDRLVDVDDLIVVMNVLGRHVRISVPHPATRSDAG
ncbi:MAG: hypothetical protein ACYTJ0_14835 [Planctomycetota bacterium]